MRTGHLALLGWWPGAVDQPEEERLARLGLSDRRAASPTYAVTNAATLPTSAATEPISAAYANGLEPPSFVGGATGVGS
jgi:hypothetical protein